MLMIGEAIENVGERLEAYGERHVEVAKAYKNLGHVYSFWGHNRLAMEAHLKCLEIEQWCFRGLEGVSAVDLASTYGDVGSVMEDLGMDTDALEMFERARVLDPEDEWIAEEIRELKEMMRTVGS